MFKILFVLLAATFLATPTPAPPTIAYNICPEQPCTHLYIGKEVIGYTSMAKTTCPTGPCKVLPASFDIINRSDHTFRLYMDLQHTTFLEMHPGERMTYSDNMGSIGYPKQ